MDENLKKPKRPRIGETNPNLDENLEGGRYEKVEYSAHEPNQGEENTPAEGYQQQEGGYQQRQGGYRPRQGGYQQRQGGYQPRYQQRQEIGRASCRES